MNTTYTLANPIQITVTKTNSEIRYPLSFVQMFASSLEEQIIYQSDFLIDGCIDGANAANPTCGWAKTSSGENIPNSQGYCCTCALAQMLGLSDQRTRASLDCTQIGMRASSAHCLRYGSLYYSAFGVGSAQTYFSINITLQQSGSVVRNSPPQKRAQAQTAPKLWPKLFLASNYDYKSKCPSGNAEFWKNIGYIGGKPGSFYRAAFF